jgi:RNA-directed DNA polymerase
MSKSMERCFMDLIERLQTVFPLTTGESELMIKTAPHRYKVHFIEKRNGRGMREIAQPTAEMKLVQRWLITAYLNELPVHPAAMAYRPKNGIRHHAQLHASNKYLLKLDFENFFPSILARDFRVHLARYSKLPLPDSRALTRLLFRLDKDSGALSLSIGAPSSPAVSNTVMYPFDLAIAVYCDSIDVKYSRYADDLAFSTNTPHVLDRVQDFVRQTCRHLAYPTLTLNESKTVFTSKKFQRQLTGLILTNDGQISLGRDRKREIRSMAHHFSVETLPIEKVSHLRGLLSFALSVEPQFVESIKRMVGERKYAALMRGSSGTTAE